MNNLRACPRKNLLILIGTAICIGCRGDSRIALASAARITTLGRIKEPDPHVLRWLESQDETTLYLSVLTIGELQKGISKLGDGPKKLELQSWVSNDLVARFEGRLLAIDGKVAAARGKLLGVAEEQGKKLPVMDNLIAATAMTHNLTVVKPNTRDLERCQAKVLNPWKNEICRTIARLLPKMEQKRYVHNSVELLWNLLMSERRLNQASQERPPAPHDSIYVLNIDSFLRASRN